MKVRASLLTQMVKNLPGNAGDSGLIPGSGRSPGEGNTTPVFLSGEFHGQMSLAGYGLQSHKEPDMTERLTRYFYKTNPTQTFFFKCHGHKLNFSHQRLEEKYSRAK